MRLDLRHDPGRVLSASSLMAVFIAWERRSTHPMLDVRIFRNARFSAASLAVAFAFFALFGFIFLITQYFQIVRGYDTLSAGVHTLPFAVAVGITSPLSARLALRIGTKAVVAGGLALMGAGFLVASTNGVDTPYWGPVVIAMVLIAAGLGLATAPATESIMGALPPRRPGWGRPSTTRPGSSAARSAWPCWARCSPRSTDRAWSTSWAGSPSPPRRVEAAKESVGATLVVAERATAQAGPQAGQVVLDARARRSWTGWERHRSWLRPSCSRAPSSPRCSCPPGPGRPAPPRSTRSTRSSRLTTPRTWPASGEAE